MRPYLHNNWWAGLRGRLRTRLSFIELVHFYPSLIRLFAEYITRSFQSPINHASDRAMLGRVHAYEMNPDRWFSTTLKLYLDRYFSFFGGCIL